VKDKLSFLKNKKGFLSTLKYWLKKNYLLYIVLIFAIFIRFYKLGAIPISTYWDETAILLDAKSLANTGKDIHQNSIFQTMFISYGDYKLPVYIWLAGLSVKIFGATEMAMRLPSAIMGIATIFVASLIAVELFTAHTKSRVICFKKNLDLKIVFLTTALVVASSPWSVMFSRTGFEGHTGQLFMALAALVLLKSRQHKHYKWIAQILAVVATYTYFSVRFVWPVIFIIIAAFLKMDLFKIKSLKKIFIKKKSLGQAQIFTKFLISGVALPLAIYLTLLLPMYRSPHYQASNQFRLSTTSVLNMKNWPVESNIYKLKAGNKLIDKVFYHPYILMGRELIKNYADNMSFDFMFLSGDSNLRHGTGVHGLFLLPFLPIFLVGLYQLLTQHKWQSLILIGWWLAALLPASVPETTPHALRALNALVPLSVIIGFGLAESYCYIFNKNKNSVLTWMRQLFGKISQHKSYKNIFNLKSFAIIYALIIAISIFQFSCHYFTQYPIESAYDWQEGYKQLAIKILEKKDPVRTVWVNIHDERFFLWVIAYSNYDHSDYQVLKNSHTLNEIDNIKFIDFDWEKLETLDHRLIVAGKTDEIERFLKEEAVLSPNWKEEIHSLNTESLFTLVEFGQ
jgi:hypothetical protein